MKLGIMQPYFFPYIGYYSLIKNTDKWIVFDEVQFIRHGWIERNRILKPGEGWQYVGVPLQKHSRETLIKDVLIREEDWRDKLYRQIDHYRKAPFFNAVKTLLEECFSIETQSITILDAHILACTCKYIGIAFNYEIFSEMKLDIEPVTDAGEWALNISKALNATTYINPPGGIELFDKDKFAQAGIKLQFLQPVIAPYSQRRKTFEAGLSILDVMMFNSPEVINQMLDDYNITE